MTALLPEAFRELEPYVDEWSVNTLAARDLARLSSTRADREAFYTAAERRLPEAFDYLCDKSDNEMNDADQRLMNMMLSLMHVFLAQEVQGDFEEFHALGAKAMPIVRGHMDAE